MKTRGLPFFGSYWLGSCEVDVPEAVSPRPRSTHLSDFLQIAQEAAAALPIGPNRLPNRQTLTSGAESTISRWRDWTTRCDDSPAAAFC